MKNEERGPWYLITGLFIGAIIGLLYAWIVQPVQYVDTSPASLRSDFKDSYRVMIASAYVGNGDLVRAEARLELLEDDDLFRTVSEQAQRTLAEDGSTDDARALGLLAVALGGGSSAPVSPTPQKLSTERRITPSVTLTPSVAFTKSSTETLTQTLTPTQTIIDTVSPTETDQLSLERSPTSTDVIEADTTPTETPTLRPSYTPTSTRTPTKTPGGAFVLLSREKVCDPPLEAPLFQIEASNAFGDHVPGVVVIVNWGSNEDRFFTGLKPEKGLGYADYRPSPDFVYTVRLGESGQPVRDLAAPECIGPFGERFWGAWMLKFVQP